MEKTVLSVKSLSKKFRNITAISDLSLEVEKGNVYGILGPNGSGKTTTLGILLGVLQSDTGSYEWFGSTPDSGALKRIGALLESPNFYPYLTARQNLKIIAGIRNADYSEIDRVLLMTRLFERGDHKFQTFSLGMKQRLAIASALLGNPEVLILDEPTNGLDPTGIAEIRELISQVSADGTTVILASHLLDEVQKVCSHVAVLQKGKTLFSGRVDEVLSSSGEIVLNSMNADQMIRVLPGYAEYVSHTIRNGFVFVKTTSQGDPAALNAYLFNHGIVCTHLSVQKKSLEHYFLELTSKSSEVN